MEPLAARLARGDEAAFVELYDACADRLHHYVVARLGSRDVAADVVQSVFLRAVRSRRRFRGVENPVAYLFQIARNESARAAKRIPKNTRSLDELYLVGRDERGQREDAEVVATAMGRLDDADREIVELKIHAGLSLREIAVLTGLPQGTVATKYRRALESLGGWLTKQFR